MKKYLFFILIILINLNLFSNEKKESDKKLIKRSVLVLPFYNKNDIEKYDYLNDTMVKAIESNLIDTKQFNIIKLINIEKKIDDSGYTNESITKPENAMSFAKSHGSDVVVIGNYIIFEDKILIQIEVFDIFTKKIVDLTTTKGSVGIDLLRIIDKASIDITKKMSDKLDMIKESYYKEMMENNKTRFNLTNINKAGIILTAIGGTFLLTGVPILIYNLAGYSTILRNNKEYYEKTEKNYEQLTDSYYIFIGLFSSSLTISTIGFIFLCIGIPLIVVKTKNKKISLNIKIDKHISFFMSYNF